MKMIFINFFSKEKVLKFQIYTYTFFNLNLFAPKLHDLY